MDALARTTVSAVLFFCVPFISGYPGGTEKRFQLQARYGSLIVTYVLIDSDRYGLETLEVP